MKRSERSEMAGLVLLGVALFALALGLRAGQPGALDCGVQPWIWPAGAGVLYAAAAFLMAGAWLERAALWALMVVAHALDAALMGLAFGAGQGADPAAALVEGLWGYPPAVALQVAFVLPLGWVVLRRRAVEAVPGAELLARAATAQELLRAVVSVEAKCGAGADAALVAVAGRARAILAAAPAEERQETVDTRLQPRLLPDGEGGADGGG